MIKNFIFTCLTLVILFPLVNANALPGDAELVLEDIHLDPINPKKGDLVTITADVYNAGLKNTGSLASIVTIAYFVDGELFLIGDIGNIEPGISNKTKISYSDIWTFDQSTPKIKIVLDYHDTLNDVYDSPVDNSMEKSFSIESLNPSTLSLEISPTYIIPGNNLLTISASLTDSETNMPLIDKKITLSLGDKTIDLLTNKKGLVSISDTITTFGLIAIEADFEGDSQYTSSHYFDDVYSFPQKPSSSFVLEINDFQDQYNFEDYSFDIVVFQNSYDTLIETLSPDSDTLLDSKTFILSLPPDHYYFAEIYLDGRLFFITDKFLLEENNLLFKELKFPERATIKFEIVDSKNQPVTDTVVKNWFYSMPAKNGSTDWIDILPTVYDRPYIAEVFLSDQKISESKPFFLFSGERKTIPIMIITEIPQMPIIPSWIKNSAGWWADGAVDDSSFIQGMQYLIKEEILQIPVVAPDISSNSNEIPSWIKNSAGWWADGAVDDSSFIQGMQYLIKEGIMVLS